MSQQSKKISDKALLLNMATMWLRLAEIAEQNERLDEPPSDS
jgi:hypothetical protein